MVEHISVADSVSLGLGFLLGDDAGFSYDLRQQSRLAGVSHLVAASGANIALVTWLPERLRNWLGWLGVEASSVFLVVLYCLVAGVSPSLGRATLLWIAIRAGAWTGRKLSLGRRIGLPILLAGIVRAQWLGELGFWLSWTAWLGMIVSQIVADREKKLVILPQNNIPAFISAWVTGAVVWWLVAPILIATIGARAIVPSGVAGTWILGAWATPLALLAFARESLRSLAVFASPRWLDDLLTALTYLQWMASDTFWVMLGFLVTWRERWWLHLPLWVGSLHFIWLVWGTLHFNWQRKLRLQQRGGGG